MDLVIVESPAKAKTINQYLGLDNAKVLASFGHVRDLPERDGSVDPDQDFQMSWEERNDLREIKTAMKTADRLVLATDPDREGEAISWHVLEVLQNKKLLDGKDVCRVVFNAITKKSILAAMKEPRQIDGKLVDAYLARRALDYLVGFNLSPVLWRKLPGARSAGRVQSVALRLICEREIEIEQFKPREYWSVDTIFTNDENIPLTARLAVWNGKKTERYTLQNEADARVVEAAVKANPFHVEEVESKPEQRNPAPPFTTSTLQQEASRKLNFNTARTMDIAQRLYKDGHITYMRTDSTNIIGEAIDDIRTAIDRDFGPEYIPASPRKFKAKSSGAQEAHEAVRPVDPRNSPQEMRRQLGEDESRLYELIWKRAVASQMKNAEVQRTTIIISSDDKQIGFRATGTVITFHGFLKLYVEGQDDRKSDDDKELTLPQLGEGEILSVDKVMPEQHFTTPPPRFNEASLVKRMEELGIGRPATYASIISVLRERDYVRMDGKRFIPEDKGRLVVSFLESFFQRYVEYDFTADLENDLDKVAEGSLGYKEVLAKFWNDFHATVESTLEIRNTQILDTMNEVMGEHIFKDMGDGKDPRKCPQCDGGDLSLKTGRYGAFVGCTRYPDCGYTRPFASDGKDGSDLERILGDDPESGKQVHVKQGRFGAYIQLGEMVKGEDKPPRATIPKGKEPADMTLDYALLLLSLPRNVGAHPETGEDIMADIGRYGPYLRSGKSTASLEEVDEVFEIGVNRAVTVLANKPKRGKGGAQSQSVIKELGEHPEDGKPVRVLNGRFGPYVKHDKINASVPKTETPEEMTLERAVELIAARKAKGPGGKSKKRAAPKKATAKKKTGAKKTTAKKKPATKKTKAK